MTSKSIKFLFSESSASYGAGDEARRCLLRKHIVSSPSSRRGSTVHWTVEFNRSSLCRLQKRADAESICSYGAGDEARTRYLHLGKVALYRMSYARMVLTVRTRSSGFAVRSWCLRSESNQRHEDFQSSALPTELQRHVEQRNLLNGT